MLNANTVLSIVDKTVEQPKPIEREAGKNYGENHPKEVLSTIDKTSHQEPKPIER